MDGWWIDGVPELRIQMRRVDPHFGKVLGMGFPDCQNVPRPCKNVATNQGFPAANQGHFLLGQVPRSNRTGPTQY